MRKMNETLRELILGIIIWMILFSVIGALFIVNKREVILGIIFGASVAIGLAIHMYKTINKVLDFDPDNATKYSKKVATMRVLVMVLAIVVAMMFPKIFHVIGVFLGMIGLKISAYLQPITNKYITKKLFKKGR